MFEEDRKGDPERLIISFASVHGANGQTFSSMTSSPGIIFTLPVQTSPTLRSPQQDRS